MSTTLKPRNPIRLTAAIVIGGLVLSTLTGCSSTDKGGCNVINDDLQSVYQLVDRWRYGNAPTSDMLDTIRDLQDSAAGQVAAADTPAFKKAAAGVKENADRFYRAVNTGIGGNAAAGDLVSSDNALQTVCATFS